MAAVAEELGLSEAIGALMAGVVLSETSVREEIEERFFSFRDVFAALFFFVFGLSIDVGKIGEVGWLVALAVAVDARRQDRHGHDGRGRRRLHEAAEPERRGWRSWRTASSRSSSPRSRPRTTQLSHAIQSSSSRSPVCTCSRRQ